MIDMFIKVLPYKILEYGEKKDSLVKGMRDSSVLCILHFSTPKSLLRGKDLSWFFRPIRDSVVNSFLST